MIFNSYFISLMLFVAYSDYYVDYKNGCKELAAELKTITGHEPMSLQDITQNPEKYQLPDQVLQALEAVRRIVKKLTINPHDMLINFGSINSVCCVYSDRLIAIDSEFVAKVPNADHQDHILAHELGHIHYKHRSTRNKLNLIVPVFLELGLFIAYVQGCKCLYPPKYKDTTTIKHFFTHLLATYIATFFLGYARAAVVFLLQRMIGRYHELQADNYAVQQLGNPQAAINCIKSRPADPAFIYKNYHKRPWRSKISFYWQEYKKYCQGGYWSHQAICLALMPHWSCTHPDYSQRIKNIQIIKI